MKTIQSTISKPRRPICVLQYGEGHFLRGFVDYMIDVANEKGVFHGDIQIIKSTRFGSIDALRAQDCVYTVLLRGKQGGKSHAEKRVITSVAGVTSSHDDYGSYAAFSQSPDLRFILSNTTEAGIVYDDSDLFTLTPPKSYPGKLTRFLFERYEAFHGAKDKGLIILPTELIENNGMLLKEYCLKLAELWNLPGGFTSWLTQANLFCNTLVDRIITGFPESEAEALWQKWGYEDRKLVAGEPYALWVIESEIPDVIKKEFPLDKAGLPVIFTDNLRSYRERKVRILNGTHTASVFAAYLSGLDTVADIMADSTLRAFLERAMYTELVPSLAYGTDKPADLHHTPPIPMADDEAKAYADFVMERFENPYIRHNLLSIALNSVSKFKARLLPAILEAQEKTKAVPKLLCFSLAALMAFYSGNEADGKSADIREGNDSLARANRQSVGGKPTGIREEIRYAIVDDAAVLDFFALHRQQAPKAFVEAFLARADFWGSDLSLVPDFAEAVALSLQSIRDHGMRGAVEKVLYS